MDMKTWIRTQWDRVAAGSAVTVGAIALLIGYRGVSDALYPGQQIPYIISGGLFGLFLVGVGAALWLSADLRDEWRKLDDLDDKLAQILEHQRRGRPSADSPMTSEPSDIGGHRVSADEPDRPGGASQLKRASNGHRRSEPMRAR